LHPDFCYCLPVGSFVDCCLRFPLLQIKLLSDGRFILLGALVRVAMMTEDSADVVSTLMDYVEGENLAVSLLKHAITKEVVSTGNSPCAPIARVNSMLMCFQNFRTASATLLFRGESVATKLTSTFLFREGKGYLGKLVQPLVQQMYALKSSLEVRSYIADEYPCYLALHLFLPMPRLIPTRCRRRQTWKRIHNVSWQSHKILLTTLSTLPKTVRGTFPFQYHL